LTAAIAIKDLGTVAALRDLPAAHLQWIADHSEYKEYEEGSILTKTGEPIDELWFIIEGKGNFYLDVNGRLIHYFTFENNNETGGVGGLLPYSRMKASPGYTFMVGKGRIVLLHKRYFPELEKLNPELIQRLIGYMTERARVFATLRIQQEKVSALGKLSAGIAHELNNPAAAIARIADELNKRLLRNYTLTQQLLHQKIDPLQVEALHKKVVQYQAETQKKPALTAMQRLEKEDEMRAWLQASGLEDCRQESETFTEAGWSVADIKNICDNVGSQALCDVLRWLENLLTSSTLLKDLSDASARISTLVAAIKSHVHMDRTIGKVPTNIHTGIESTLTLLGYKIREKNIRVKKIFSDALPPVDAFVGELNQVWSNIIDNAIFALNENGELVIETSNHDNQVTVKITDNGPGIPAEVQPHIFEPYFTTKNVGEGSGIGLDIVSRIVQNHNGQIEVQSRPGQTVFTVCLPVAQPQEVK
jgi:signal transduction histidine kinase